MITHSETLRQYKLARYILPAEYNSVLKQALRYMQYNMDQSALFVLLDAQDRHTKEKFGF